MEIHDILLIILGSIWFIAVLYHLFVYNPKRTKRIDKVHAEQELLFNKCIDLIMKGKVDEVQEIYNTTLLDINQRKAFLNGLMIGLDLEANKERLLDNKY